MILSNKVKDYQDFNYVFNSFITLGSEDGNQVPDNTKSFCTYSEWSAKIVDIMKDCELEVLTEVQYRIMKAIFKDIIDFIDSKFNQEKDMSKYIIILLERHFGHRYRLESEYKDQTEIVLPEDPNSRFATLENS